MKSLIQIQNEMISRCRFDEGYPRAVFPPPAAVATARDEKEYLRRTKRARLLMKLLVACGVVVALAGVLFLWAIATGLKI
jgi:hypothetical protein